MNKIMKSVYVLSLCMSPKHLRALPFVNCQGTVLNKIKAFYFTALNIL